MIFYGDKKDVARFVVDLVVNSKFDYRWITIMPRVKFAGCYVRIATAVSLEDLVKGKAQSFSLRLIGTYLPNTPGG